MPSKVEKTLEASLKDRIDSYDDQELRQECLNEGLKPGPVNNQTRTGWAKRLLSKRLKNKSEEKAAAAKAKSVDAEFSADEEAINGGEQEVPEPNSQAVESEDVDKATETTSGELVDAEFSDDDAPVEEDKVEVADKVTSESLMVNISESKTEDTSSMEVEATIEASEEKDEAKPEETPEVEEEVKPEEAKCQVMTCLKSKVEECQAYFCEHRQEIFEFVVVLLLAYFVFRFKNEIEETVDKLAEHTGQLLSKLKSLVMADDEPATVETSTASEAVETVAEVVEAAPAE